MRDQKLAVRLFLSYLAVVVLALTLIILFATRATEDFYFQQSINNLSARAILVDEILESGKVTSPDSLQTLCQRLGNEIETRITLIDPSGRVLADSEEDPVNMDSHHDRPEILQVLAGQEGISRRSSYTLEEEHLYFAKMGSASQQAVIIRVSFPTLALKSALGNIKENFLMGGFLIVILLAMLNWYLSNQILKPIQIMEAGAKRFARGKLKVKIPESSIRELGSLAKSLNLMAEEIYDRIRVITQQKNEQMAILSSMTEGVLALSPNGELLSCNRAASNMFGIHPKSIKGRQLHEVIRHTELMDFVMEVLKSKKSQECSISIFEPEERTLSVIGNRMPAKRGAPGGAVLVLTDLTQIHRLEGVRREFVANVSHELRTPITSIQGYVETLQDGAIHESDNASKFLEIIAKHANRLGQIVDDLLELSRIEEIRGTEKQYLKTTELNPVIDETLSQFTGAAERRSITLAVDLEKGIELDLNGKLFSHALANLLDNAIKYSDRGTTISVRSRKHKNSLTLEIQDRGQGIEDKHLSRLFERFYRVDKGRSREVGGTGLGLSIVKHIARIHHAEIEVESVQGEGSTFRMIFPLQES